MARLTCVSPVVESHFQLYLLGALFQHQNHSFPRRLLKTITAFVYQQPQAHTLLGLPHFGPP